MVKTKLIRPDTSETLLNLRSLSRSLNWWFQIVCAPYMCSLTESNHQSGVVSALQVSGVPSFSANCTRLAAPFLPSLYPSTQYQYYMVILSGPFNGRVCRRIPPVMFCSQRGLPYPWSWSWKRILKKKSTTLFNSLAWATTLMLRSSLITPLENMIICSRSSRSMRICCWSKVATDTPRSF